MASVKIEMLIAVSKINFYIKASLSNMLKFVINRFSKVYMRFTIFFLLITFVAHSQDRMNEPLPIFAKKPIATLKKGVTGWSFSEDGQWVSSKRTIPVITNSLNLNVHKTRKNRIGIDNFKEFQIYPIIYGADTLVLMTKLYKGGYYKYRKSQRGWQTYKKCHYFIFNKKDLQNLDAIKDSLIQNVRIPLLGDGEFIYKRNYEILDKVKKNATLNPKHKRELIVTIQPFTAENRIRFQFFSKHKKYKDIGGVLTDFEIEGYTVYGKTELFNHLYYETDIDIFSSFFIIPKSFKFKH